MTTEELHNFNVDSEGIEILKDFGYVHSVISANGDCSQAIRRRLRLRRAAIKELEKIIKCKDVSLETNAKIIRTLVFPITIYGCGSWIVNKTDRKKINLFDI